MSYFAGGQVIEVFQPGGKATVAGSLPAVVLAVILEMHSVWYRIGYWNNNSWTETNVPASEVQQTTGEKRQVGFKLPG